MQTGVTMTTLFRRNIQPDSLFSNFRPKQKIGRLLNFPLTRIFVIALFLAPFMLVNALVVLQVIEQVEEPLATNIDILRMLLMIPFLLISYAVYCRIFEKRKAHEISFPGSAREWMTGFLVATCLVVLFVALISVFGSFEIEEFRSAKVLFTNFLAFGMGSLFQELVLLCVLFRLVEEYAGTWVALVISLLVFSFAHAANPNQNLVSGIFLATSSIVLIAPFILTRRIWVSWGFHAGWNFMQAGVFGMANSGILFPGWMVTKIGGPEWLTGGDIGLEGSFLAAGADLAIGLVILFTAIQAGKIVSPAWKRTISVEAQ
jgi:membrane protease YdiL (CAAX protease family)